MAIASGEVPIRFLPTFGLFVARFCTSAWIGAATLFVIVGVTEVTRGGFDAATKDVLVAVRFPAFYVCGAVLVGTGWAGSWVARCTSVFSRGRRLGVLVLLAAVLVLMSVDYVWVYRPLLRMVSPPGQTKSPVFVQYHEASKWINLAGLTLSLAAAWLVNWPARSPGGARSPE